MCVYVKIRLKMYILYVVCKDRDYQNAYHFGEETSDYLLNFNLAEYRFRILAIHCLNAFFLSDRK